MAFCSNCGARIPDNARFCEECGTPVAAPSGRRVERKTDDYFDNREEVNEIFASDEEGEMSLGSWEEEEPAARPQPRQQQRPQPRRAPRYEDEGEEDYDDEPKKKESKGSFLKTLKTGVLAIGLPILLVLGGIWVYGLIKGNDGNGGSGNVKYRPNQLPDPSEQTESAPIPGSDGETKKLRAGTNKPEQEDVFPSGTNDPEFFDLEADDSSFKSEEEMKEYEKEVLNEIRKEYEDKYTGTWQAEGRYLFNFSEVEDLMNKDVATLIERTMDHNENVSFAFGNGKACFFHNGEESIYGDYFVRESGNITIDNNGETLALWMYSPNEKTLYCYIYHINDEGTPMAMAYKFKRINTKPKF